MAFRNQVTAISQLIADRLIGAYIATAEDGTPRWVLSDETDYLTLRAFSEDPIEELPASILLVPPSSGDGWLSINGPEFNNGGGSTSPAGIMLGADADVPDSYITILADRFLAFIDALARFNVGDFLVDSAQDVNLNANGGGIGMTASGDVDIATPTGGNQFFTAGAGGFIDMFGSGGIDLSTGGNPVTMPQGTEIGPSTVNGIKAMNFGVATVPILAGASVGSLVVNHNLGAAPTGIMLGMGSNTASYCCSHNGGGLTQMTINAFHRAGVVGAVNLNVSWLAVRA